MPDGAKLGARLWLPDAPAGQAYPAILEYIPYRKDDYSALRDSATIAWFSSKGYACLRVDMRGSGSSDGIMFDEYSDQEIGDGVDVINWMAAQDWCDGNVGTIGISWGGITGLQLAQRQPEALKTVVALGATEFRYYDDGSYYMGCMVGQTIGWGTLMFGYNTRPPDPNLQGDKWRTLWLERLNSTPHYLENWLSHQREDEYWLRGTVGADYGAINVPVYAVSGHADCWPNTVPRLLENLSGPVKGLQGAWCHRYPHLGVPGPTVNFLEDAARWFDHWMKGEDTGMMEEAGYQVYLQDSVKPQPYYDHRPGQWVGEPAWPSSNVEEHRYYLNQSEILGGLSATAIEGEIETICSPQTVGLASGEYMPWFAFGRADELPDDQQIEDAGSLVFDMSVEGEDLIILGNPHVMLNLRSNQTQSLAAVRLCDVWPDGSSTLITRGILNLSQRNSKKDPEELKPGTDYAVSVKLNHVGYIVPVGHVLRVSVSTSYWPIAWPSAHRSTLYIKTGASYLQLPQRKADASSEKIAHYKDAGEQPTPLATTQLRAFKQHRSIDTVEETGESVFTISADNGKTRFDDNGVEMGSTALQRYSIHPDNPLSAKAEYEWVWEYGRGKSWNTKTFTRTEISCDDNHFFMKALCIAWENGEEVFRKTWDESYPRDHF